MSTARCPPLLLLCPAFLAGLAAGPSLALSPAVCLLVSALCVAAALLLSGPVRLPLVLAACFILALGRSAPLPGVDPLHFPGPMLWTACLQSTVPPHGRAPVPARLLAAYPAGPHGGEVASAWRGERDVEIWWPWQRGRPSRGLRGECWLLKGQLRSPKHGRRQQAQLSVAKPGLQLRPAQRRLDRLEHRFSAAVSALRTRVRRGLDLAAPPAQHALFAALAMGDRTGLDDRDREAFVRTGTAHLLAISGLHVGLVALTLVALLRRPLGLLLIWVARPMAAAGWSSHLALAVSVSGAALYVLVAGSPVSARRALLMIVCAAAASLLERPRAGAHGLALAALGIAWLDPLSIFDTALHLSVVSVAGLLLLSGCMGPSRTGRLRWLQASLSLVAASAAAAAATAPICLWAFGRVPLAGLWVNPLVVPLLGSLTLPPLLAGAGLSAVSPRLGAPLLQVAAWPAALGSRVVRWAALPERSPELVAELAAADVCALYCVCAALATLLYVARRSR